MRVLVLEPDAQVEGAAALPLLLQQPQSHRAVHAPLSSTATSSSAAAHVKPLGASQGATLGPAPATAPAAPPAASPATSLAASPLPLGAPLAAAPSSPASATRASTRAMESSIASFVPDPMEKCAVCAESPRSTVLPSTHRSHRTVGKTRQIERLVSRS